MYEQVAAEILKVLTCHIFLSVFGTARSGGYALHQHLTMTMHLTSFHLSFISTDRIPSPALGSKSWGNRTQRWQSSRAGLFFFLVSWKSCVIARRRICVEHGPGEQTHREVRRGEARLPQSRKSECPVGNPEKLLVRRQKQRTGSVGAQTEPRQAVPPGAQPPQPAWPTRPGIHTHRNLACANRKGSSSPGVKGSLQKEEHRQEGQTC